MSKKDPGNLKHNDIIVKMMQGSTEASLLEDGYTQAEIRAAISAQVKELIARFDGMTPERAFAEWLIAKEPIINEMIFVMRQGPPRDRVAAATLLDKMQDSRLAKAMELGLVKPSAESKETIALSDEQLAARAREMLKQLDDLGDSNIVDLAPRRVQRAN